MPILSSLLKLTCSAVLLMLGCSKKLSTDSHRSITDIYADTYSVRLMKGGRKWLSQNLNINIPESFCYGDSVENCLQYGRLYTWESARKGCEMLGKEWRLPTNDEWEQMAQHYGGIRIDPQQDGKEALPARPARYS